MRKYCVDGIVLISLVIICKYLMPLLLPFSERTQRPSDAINTGPREEGLEGRKKNLYPLENACNQSILTDSISPHVQSDFVVPLIGSQIERVPN